VTLAGAILGFLRFNFNPATIFLGDSGSLFIGFMLSALALAGAQKAPTFVAVAIPEDVYPKSDLASAFFDVSVNKSLTAEQCGEFSEAKVTEGKVPEEKLSEEKATPATPIETTGPSAKTSPKLMIGDMELHSTETLATDGTRKEAAKYFHIFENGSCYEFALKVATTGVETDEGGKAVDRNEVFKRLAKILATVKIGPVKNTEATTSVPAAAPSTSASVTPAQ